MIPMNNPVLQAAMSGMRPVQFLQQMTGRDPMIAQARSLIQGKTPEQLYQIADNMARQCGTTVENISKQYGVPIDNLQSQNKN